MRRAQKKRDKTRRMRKTVEPIETPMIPETFIANPELSEAVSVASTPVSMTLVKVVVPSVYVLVTTVVKVKVESVGRMTVRVRVVVARVGDRVDEIGAGMKTEEPSASDVVAGISPIPLRVLGGASGWVEVEVEVEKEEVVSVAVGMVVLRSDSVWGGGAVDDGGDCEEEDVGEGGEGSAGVSISVLVVVGGSVSVGRLVGGNRTELDVVEVGVGVNVLPSEVVDISPWVSVNVDEERVIVSRVSVVLVLVEGIMVEGTGSPVLELMVGRQGYRKQ